MDIELKKDVDFTWQMFEKTGKLGFFLVYKETLKNIETLEKAKANVSKDYKEYFGESK